MGFIVRNKYFILAVVFMITVSINAFGIISDPEVTEPKALKDSVATVVTEEENMAKQMNEFYAKSLKHRQPEKSFKPFSQKNTTFENIQLGEITASQKTYEPDKKKKKGLMWGEADLAFEYKEQERNYKELLKSYENQLSWAKEVNNQPIIDVMNVKIKQTKKLLKECKRKLRKF